MSDTESDPRNPKRVKLISSTAEEDIDLSELDLDQLYVIEARPCV